MIYTGQGIRWAKGAKCRRTESVNERSVGGLRGTTTRWNHQGAVAKRSNEKGVMSQELPATCGAEKSECSQRGLVINVWFWTGTPRKARIMGKEREEEKAM